MRIAKKHSHLNGEEWLLVHEKDTYQEILDVIESVDAEKCRTKISRERGRKGKTLYSPIDLNAEFDKRFTGLGVALPTMKASSITSSDMAEATPLFHL